MDRITMKTKGSHGGHGFSLIDNTERRNDDDDYMMNQARTGNRNRDMATDMEVVRTDTVETLAVGAMVETVVEVVSKMDVMATVATNEVATVDMVAMVATREVAKMNMVSVGATTVDRRMHLLNRSLCNCIQCQVIAVTSPDPDSDKQFRNQENLNIFFDV